MNREPVGVDSTGRIVFQMRSRDVGTRIRLQESLIGEVCRNEMQVLSVDFARFYLGQISAGSQAEGSVRLDFLLVAHIAPNICREVPAGMEIAEGIRCRGVVKIAPEGKGHIFAAGQVSRERHCFRTNGEILSAPQGRFFDGKGVFRRNGNVPIPCDGRVFRMNVVCRKGDVFSAEDICIGLDDFFCIECQRTVCIRCAGRGDSAPECSAADNAVCTEHGISVADDFAVAAEFRGSDGNIVTVNSARSVVFELCRTEHCGVICLHESLIGKVRS